jgi:hypothetical protein
MTSDKRAYNTKRAKHFPNNALCAKSKRRNGALGCEVSDVSCVARPDASSGIARAAA